MTKQEAIEELKLESRFRIYHAKEEALLIAIEALEEQDKHRWIPVCERLPEDSNYILLSFDNFSVPMVGRYEDDAFYIGDDVISCVGNDLFVNAWMPPPEPYQNV